MHKLLVMNNVSDTSYTQTFYKDECNFNCDFMTPVTRTYNTIFNLNLILCLTLNCNDQTLVSNFSVTLQIFCEKMYTLDQALALPNLRRNAADLFQGSLVPWILVVD